MVALSVPIDVAVSIGAVAVGFLIGVLLHAAACGRVPELRKPEYDYLFWCMTVSLSASTWMVAQVVLVRKLT